MALKDEDGGKRMEKKQNILEWDDDKTSRKKTKSSKGGNRGQIEISNSYHFISSETHLSVSYWNGSKQSLKY